MLKYEEFTDSVIFAEFFYKKRRKRAKFLLDFGNKKYIISFVLVRKRAF